MIGNDIFNEQLVKREKTPKDTLKKVGLWGSALLLMILAVMFIPSLSVIFIFLIGWGALTLNNRFNQEFEYIFTNGDLDIDIIYNKAKRKKLITIDTKRLLGMEKVQDKEHASKGFDKVLDCSSRKDNTSLYGLVYDLNHKKTRIFIEPNEAILNGILSYAPRSVTGHYGPTTKNK